MALDWIPRAPKDAIYDHFSSNEEFLGTMDKPPCTVYEKKPVINPQTGEKVDGLYTAWVTLNNSSGVVRPAITFCQPATRSVLIP